MDDASIDAARARLRARVRQVIGRPEVEAKELAAFDLIMGRRQFLKASQYTAIAGLIAAGTPPTLWGRRDPTLHVDPADVGLTVADQASATAATQVTVGTELFEETVYAQQVVSPEAVGTHALIEGARARLKLQSDLASSSPAESAFLDAGYHWGPPELVQLEQVEVNGTPEWELVHYRRQWTARTDGATDGYERHVIIPAGDGLIDPSQVVTMTGSHSNRFGGSPPTSGVTYVVVVIDAKATGGGFICAGAGTYRVSPPFDEQPPYPVTWARHSLDIFGTPKAPEFADTHRVHYGTSTTYEAANASEHIVLYYPGGIGILSLDDGGAAGTAKLRVDLPGYPQGDTDWRLVHIDGTDIVVARGGTEQQSSGAVFSAMGASMPKAAGTQGSATALLGTAIEWFPVRYPITDWAVGNDEKPTTVTVPTLSGLRDVNALFTAVDDLGFDHHVKLARIGDVVALVVLFGEGALEGIFPLQFPDAAGVGRPTKLTGGVSKFGGFRFVVSDTDGNLFLLRQRRVPDQDQPYIPPIYAQFDATGQPQPPYVTTNSQDYDPLPPTTAASSNLHDLLEWVEATVLSVSPGVTQQALRNIGYNLLLNTALAFGTDDTNASQAVWLGDTFQAGYAPARYGHDSVHVEIKRAQGSSTEFSAYLAFCNPVTKTWHEQQIASQVVPAPPGENESGDHYQATVSGANAYGRPVSLALGDNTSLRIEVRADAPTTVTDDTHDLYYDVDRYTSFMAAPDPSSGNLGLVVKAETFAQVLYVRLVDTSGLQPSSGDSAMLSSTGVTTYPWQTVNVAAQAQQRMGNDGTTTVVDLLGDAAPLVDTTQYVSGPQLFTYGDAANWTYKAGFGPPMSASDTNLASLGTYLNTSGQNLLAATAQPGLGATTDGQTIDPLTAVTAVPSDGSLATGTTTFTYPAGSIGHGATVLPGNTDLGSVWTSVSHALHDALRWLQNAADDVYKSLATGAVAVEMAADSITATVSADIMKAVNGVDEALQQVVSTVEEYANVLVNLVVTIVEQSFLYKLIAEIIALISLFFHLTAIQDLSRSLYSTFGGLGPLPTGSTSSWDAYGSDYIGTDNALTNATGVNDGASSVPDELVTGLLDAIFGNPFTKKILNKVMAYLSQFLGGLLPAPPIGFQLPTGLATEFIDDVETLAQILITDVVDLAQDAMSDLMNMIVADMEDPQATYTNLTDTLANLADEIGADVEQVFDWVDTVIAGAVSDAQTAIGTNTYLTLTIPGLADLCKLFGIGDPSGDTLKLEARDAVFFPMALVIWVAVYESTGTSINSVSELSSTTATPGDALGATASRWTIARLAVDGVMTELGGGVWSLSKFVDGEQNPAAGPFLSAAGAWFNLIRWTNDLVYTVENTTPQLPDALYLGVRTYFAVVSAVLTLPGQGLNPGDGWPGDPKRTDIVNLINAVLTIAIMGYDTYEIAAIKPRPTADQIVGVIGQDLSRTQPLATTIYDVTQGDDPPTEATIAWALYVGIVPAVGWVLQGTAAAGEFSDPDDDGRPGRGDPMRQGPPPGRPPRPQGDDPPGRARRRRPNG